MRGGKIAKNALGHYIHSRLKYIFLVGNTWEEFDKYAEVPMSKVCVNLLNI
jgi:hypothetical protein